MSGRSATAVTDDGEPLVLVEANIGQGVVAAPLSKYARFHTRICRPTKLTAEDCARVCAYATERIGFDYDLKNIIDLMRYLFPLPVPQRWRRRMMALGSGHPTRIICSALIAQAFENVRYPILPKVTRATSEAGLAGNPGNPPFLALSPRAISTSRPISRWSSRLSLRGFDYKAMAWADLPIADDRRADVAGVDRERDGRRPTRCRQRLNRPTALPSLPRAALALVRMIDAAVKALGATVHAAAARRADEGRSGLLCC